MHVRCRGISAQHYWSGFQSTSSTRVIDRVTMKNAWGNKLANNNKIFFARQSSYTRTRLGHVLKLFLLLCYALSTFWACVCTGPWLAMHTCIYEPQRLRLLYARVVVAGSHVLKGSEMAKSSRSLDPNNATDRIIRRPTRHMHAKLQTFFT